MNDRPYFLTYADFWPYYLRQHSNRTTRTLHITGTLLTIAAILIAIIFGQWAWLLAALVAGYGFAWIAHVLVEKNRPATFGHPLWSLRGDFDMLWLTLKGRLQSELIKYKIPI